jgi:nucleoside-triphosphatase
MRRAERRGGVIVIDELGRMELASDRFMAAVHALLEADQALVATVHARRHPVTDAVKRREDVEVIEVSHDNRDELAGKLITVLLQEHAGRSGRKR